MLVMGWKVLEQLTILLLPLLLCPFYHFGSHLSSPSRPTPLFVKFSSSWIGPPEVRTFSPFLFSPSAAGYGWDAVCVCVQCVCVCVKCRVVFNFEDEEGSRKTASKVRSLGRLS